MLDASGLGSDAGRPVAHLIQVKATPAPPRQFMTSFLTADKWRMAANLMSLILWCDGRVVGAWGMYPE